MNMNPYLGFKMAVNFISLFFSIIQMLYKNIKIEKILINMMFKKSMPVAIPNSLSHSGPL
jgi:hypothetical protein